MPIPKCLHLDLICMPLVEKQEVKQHIPPIFEKIGTTNYMYSF